MTSLKRIHKEIRRLDPKLEPGSETFNAALVTLSSGVIGPNIRRLAKFTGLPIRFVTEIGRRLRQGHVWVGNKVSCDWNNKETGGVEFWLDVCVGQGLLKRTP